MKFFKESQEEWNETGGAFRPCYRLSFLEADAKMGVGMLIRDQFLWKEERKIIFAREKPNHSRELTKLQPTWVGSQIYIAVEVFHTRLARAHHYPCLVCSLHHRNGAPPESWLSETRADPEVAGIWTLSAKQITQNWVASPNLLNVRYNPIKHVKRYFTDENTEYPEIIIAYIIMGE